MADRDESHSVQSNTPNEVPSNEELLNRISNLEALLVRQSSSQAFEMGYGDRCSSNLISTPRESRQMGQLSPASIISDNSSPSTVALPERPSYGIGALKTTGDGNVRYEPNLSQWTSVLANTSLSTSTTSIVDADAGVLTNGFPFSCGPVPSLDDLLAILPPSQQCDYLKDMYFSVFSPVSVAITPNEFCF